MKAQNTLPPCDICGAEHAGLIQYQPEPHSPIHTRVAARKWVTRRDNSYITVCKDCCQVDPEHESTDSKMLERYSKPGYKFRKLRKGAK